MIRNLSLRLFFTAFEWPPKPKVASINIPSGTGVKISTISLAMTGMWFMSDQELPGHIFIGFCLALPVFAEDLRIPQFNFFIDTEDNNLFLNLCRFEEHARDGEPSHAIELRVLGIWEKGSFEPAGLGVGHFERFHV